MESALTGSVAGEKPCSAEAGRFVLVATILGTSMAFIDSTVVNVALPLIQKNLGASVMGAQWIIEAYALLLSSLLLVGGALGDRFGRKRVFVIGVAVFAVASVGCGLARDIRELVAARALQGLGAALLVPGSLALIGSCFPPDRRGSAIGTWSAWSAAATAIGPVLGGWLAQSVSWRAVFWINLPLAVAVIAIAILKVPESRREDAPPLDLAGATLVTAALSAVVLGLVFSSGHALGEALVAGPVALGIALFVLFLAVEKRTEHPMLPTAIFRSRVFAGANIVTFCLYAALTSVLFFLPFDLIQARGFSPAVAGTAPLPLVVLLFALSRWSGGLADHFGPRLPLTVGPAIAAAGMVLLGMLSSGVSYWSGVFPGVCVLALGMGVTVAPLTTAVINSVDSSQVGLASGVNNAVARLSGLLAVAVLGLLTVAIFGRSLDRRLEASGLVQVAREIALEERLKLGAMDPPSGLAPEEARRFAKALAGSVSDAFRAVALASAGLAALGAVIGAGLPRGPMEVRR